jgi:hypothetical protein
MRNAKLKTVAASFAAVAMIVSLGTSAALARGGGGGGHGGGFAGGHFGGGTFLGAGAGFGGLHAGGGFAQATECMAAFTAIAASTAVTTPVWSTRMISGKIPPTRHTRGHTCARAG